jgi:hemerythrin-like domain-containing protein
MTPQDPVTDLMNDHRLIEAVMTAVERKLSSEAEFPASFLGQALDFFVEYADRFHHAKEEDALFPALAGRGVPVEGGPIGMMLYEHTLGRKLLSDIRKNLPAADQGDEEACAAIRDRASQYIGLLRNHIWKEDNVLFRMAQGVLDEAACQQLMERFERSIAANRETVVKHRAFAASNL